MVKTDIVLSKKRLAYEITKFIRGEADARLAEEMSKNLFASTSVDKSNAPTVEVELAGDEIGVLDLLLNAKFVSSKGEARRLIEQNGISMEGEVLTNPQLTLTKAELKEGKLFKKHKKCLFFLNLIFFR